MKAYPLAARYLAVVLLAGTLYAVSCAPGALWQDSGLIQYRVWHGDIEGFLGLAISHPLYYIVAIATSHIPLGEFGHRVNLVSAVAAALTVANLYLLVRLWVGRDLPAVIAAVTLAVSHTFWQHASVAETYTLWTALFLGELLVLLQYTRARKTGYLYLLGLLNGLAIAVHMLASISLLCYAVYVLVLLARRAVRGRDVAIIVALWVLGALPYEYLVVGHVARTGHVFGTLASAAFGDRWRADVLNTALSWKIVKDNILFIALNFPTPNVLLFLAGLYALGRAGSTLALRYIVPALLLLYLAFAFRYTVSDRYAFFIPFYTVVALTVGLGTDVVRARMHGRGPYYLIGALSLLPVAVYAAAPALAERANVAIGTRQDVPYRNDYRYFLQPWKTGYVGAERFAREALDTVEPNAVICADTTTVGPLLYVQEVRRVRPDVSIVTGIVRSEGAPPFDRQTLQQLIGRRPMYVTSRRPGYCPAFLLDGYELAEAGVLWRIVPVTRKGGQADEAGHAHED